MSPPCKRGAARPHFRLQARHMALNCTMQHSREICKETLPCCFKAPFGRTGRGRVEAFDFRSMAAQLSAEEAAVYDRQIRLWGVDAQARMQNSRVILAGRVDGTLAEVRRAWCLNRLVRRHLGPSCAHRRSQRTWCWPA